jgi:hypothetical protein
MRARWFFVFSSVAGCARQSRSPATRVRWSHVRQSPDQISLTAFQKVGLKARGTRARAKRVRGELIAPASGPINARVHLSAPLGQKSVRVCRRRAWLRARAWVPYGAGPLLAPLDANAPLAPSGTCGSIFAGGLWDPKGVCWSRGAYRVQRGSGRHPRLPASPVAVPRRPNAAARWSLMR